MVKSRIKGILAKRESYEHEATTIRCGVVEQVGMTYLTLIEDAGGRAATVHDVGVILVDGWLRVADGRNVLDDDVAGVFAFDDGIPVLRCIT